MKLADALVTTLRDWDLRYLFGVSGANIEHVHDAVHRLGNGKLRSVMAKTEVGAAFMADARARTHGTLGLCCATSGGGMMNLAVGLAESFADSVPVLAIVGQVATTLEGRGGFQDSCGGGRTVDAYGLFRSLCKHVVRITCADGFWEVLYAAIKAALTGRPGPSVLLINRDVYELEVAPRPAWFPARLTEFVREELIDEAKVRVLHGALRNALRPVVLLGQGASRTKNARAIREFIRRARIPVACTMSHFGGYPHDDALYLGTVGMAGHPSAHAYINEQADFILAVGTGLHVLTRKPIDRGLARCTVAAVTLDGSELLRAVTPDLLLESDAGSTFEMLLEAHRARPFERGPAQGYQLSRYAPAPICTPAHEAEPSLTASAALRILQRHLPTRGHVLYDAGNCAASALHYLALPTHVSGTIALGMGGMGYAIAGAIGAQLGAREARTLAVVGDGAFLMHGLEVHTATELGLPILFVVFNNARHGMCVTRQQLYFEGRRECSEYTRVDIARVARGLPPPDRLWVARPSTAHALEIALSEYLRLEHVRTGVLDLELTADEAPPFSPFLGPHAATYVEPAPRARP